MADADQFTGSTVLVTLHSPPGAQVRGVVLSISNQLLYLQDVYWLSSGHRTHHFQIASSNLRDLEVLPEEPQDKPTERNLGARAARLHRVSISPPLLEVNDSVPSSIRGSFSQQHTPLPTVATSRSYAPGNGAGNAPQSASAFDDPAILSVTRPPTSRRTSEPMHQELPHIISPSEEPPVLVPEVSPSTVAAAMDQILTDVRRSNLQRPALAFGRTESMATATLSEPFDDLSMDKSQDEPESEAAELGTDGGMQPGSASMGDLAVANGKASKSSRRARGKARKNGRITTSTLLPHVEEADSSPVNVKKQVQILRRPKPGGSKPVTPLAEADSFGIEDEATGSKGKAVQRSTHRSTGRGRDKLKVTEAANGWATEDATDIQELGDFDFEANHAKFDKKEVFKQLRQDDHTAEESRLVSHNRARPKPGTRNGLDLHWSESVLDAPHVVSNGVARWNSEAGETDDWPSEVEAKATSSGRDSRRATSRTSVLRAPPSRRTSGRSGVEGALEAAIDHQHPHQHPITRVLTNMSNATVRSPTAGDALSPRMGHGQGSQSQAAASPYLTSIPQPRPALRIEGSNKPCPTLAPLQMLEFEQFAITALGLSEDILAENAARGVAQTAVRVLRSSNKNANVLLRSSVVVVAGNHRTGARALAAARHLHCHGLKVTATVMGLDHEDELLEQVCMQLSALRKAGCPVVKPAVLLAGMTEARLLPNLVIDALLGIHLIFDDLRGDDQAWYYELVLLVNRNEWKVLSIDVPSGLDAQTGVMQQTDSTPSQGLAFFPLAVVSLGAPKPWVLPYFQDMPADAEPALYVADIGISNIVWKRLGNRKSKGVEFGGEWVRGLRYLAGGD